MRRLLLLLVLLSGAASAQDWRQKVDAGLLDALAGKASADAVTFLVQFPAPADLSGAERLPTKAAKGRYVFERLTAAARRHAPVVAALEAGGATVRPLWIAHALHVRGRVADVERAARQPEVARVLRDVPLHVAPALPAPRTSGKAAGATEWNLEQIGAPAVWALGITGGGAVVAGQDTGYDWAHPALQAAYRGWDGAAADHAYNWWDAVRAIDVHNTGPNPCGLGTAAPCDDGSHGTHTMGTMVGRDGEDVVGVAPGATWIGCRNMERGWGQFSTYLECFQFFLAPTDLQGANPDPARAPHVINNSWYCPEEEGCVPDNYGVIGAAIASLRAAGIAVVTSAGNSGPACSTVSPVPASFAAAFTVGATDASGVVAGFSGRGPVVWDASARLKPNVVAPGVGIRSTVPGGYGLSSGTSMAGPHVAGLVALLVAANPALAGDVATLEALIQETAVPQTADACDGVAGSVPNNTYGYGRIDAFRAVQAARCLDPSTAPAWGAGRVEAGGVDYLRVDAPIGVRGVTVGSDRPIDVRGLFSAPGGDDLTGRFAIAMGPAACARALGAAPAFCHRYALQADAEAPPDLYLAWSGTPAATLTLAATDACPLAPRTVRRDVVRTSDEPAGVPERVALEGAYPNPLAGAATVAFTLPRAGTVRLAVYDVLGREVAVLVDAPRGPGRHRVRFEADGWPAGLYLVRLHTAGETRVRPLTVAR